MSNAIDIKNDEQTAEDKGQRLDARWYEAHSVAGVLVLVPLFIMIVTGTISFFQHELEAWHIPALRVPPGEPITEVDSLLANLQEDAPREEIERMNVLLPSDHEPLLQVTWWEKDFRDKSVQAMEPQTGRRVDDNELSSELAHHIYVWHYLRPIPFGINIAGLIAIIWFALSVNGIYLHRRKLISHFQGWGKRKGRSLQSWIHTVFATVTLPLHLIYGVTGALLGLGLLFLPMVVVIVYGGDQTEITTAMRGPQPPVPEYSDSEVDSFPILDPIIAATLEARPDVTLTAIYVNKPYNEKARADVYYVNEDGQSGYVAYDLRQSADPVYFQDPDAIPASTWMLNTAFSLHFANFGGILVKLIYAVSCVGLAFIVFAGSRMWVMRHSKRSPKLSVACERIFDGFALGMLPAISIFVLANRLIPGSVPERGDWEIIVFHSAWALIGVTVVILGTSSECRRWLCTSCLLLLGTVPVLDGLLFGAWPWSAPSWYVPSVAIVNLVLLAAGSFTTYRLVRKLRLKTIGLKSEDPAWTSLSTSRN